MSTRDKKFDPSIDQRIKRVRLTESRIRSLQSGEEGSSQYLWDSDLIRFGVRAVRKQKYYIIQCRLNGKLLQLKIGDIGEFESIDSAREQARVYFDMVRQGIDPREVKKQRSAEQEAVKKEQERVDHKEQLRNTPIADLWNEYLEDRKPYWGHRHYLDHIRMVQPEGTPSKKGTRMLKPGPLAPLMRKPIADLHAKSIEAWLKKECEHRPIRARLAYTMLKTFLGWCSDHDVYQSLIGPEILSRRIKNFLPKKTARADCLQKEQLVAWFAAVRQISNPVIAVYLQTLLLTGARRAELAGLRWQDIDFRWKAMTIHDKVEGERTIPLTPFVESLLHFLPRRNQWVFSSPLAASGQIQEPRIAHNKALKIAGIEHLSIHGLRRSFGSLAEWVELPIGIVAQIMGHKPSATAERHYRVRPLDLLRKWHVKLEEWILEQAGLGVGQPAAHEPLRLVVDGGEKH